MELLRIIAHGTPHPQPRPAVTRNGHVYYPDSSKRYALWREALAEADVIVERRVPPKTALSVLMVFGLVRPRGHYRKFGELSAEGKRVPFPIAKNDTDNLAKCVLDACVERQLIVDDSLVVDLHVTKLWYEEVAQLDGRPGCIVWVAAYQPRRQGLDVPLQQA